MENDDEALAEVTKLVDKGYLIRCDSLERCRAALDGAEPVASKFGMITKVTGDKVKRRLILDSKEDQGRREGEPEEHAPGRVRHRPRRVEVHGREAPAARHRGPSADPPHGCHRGLLVARSRKEMRLFVGCLSGVFYVYRRLAQGSRGAPLAWRRLFPLVARLTQSRFGEERLRMEAYVGDPALAMAGSAQGECQPSCS